jgi:hypothetical protein
MTGPVSKAKTALETARSSSRARRLAATVLSHPIWTGVAAIATVLTVVLAIVQLRAMASQDGSIAGDCNAQGSDNTVNCAQNLPKQIGDVRLEADYSNAVWAFDGPPSALPQAPDYKAHETRFHCSVWGNWLWENNFYSVSPGGNIYAVSGETDQVAIVDYNALVYSKTAIDQRRLTHIACNHGGGDTAGYFLDYDTNTRQSLITENIEGASPRPMPPASINLTGPEYYGIALRVKSSSDYLYTGQLIVTVVINGKREQLAIGSSEHPYRWLGGEIDDMQVPDTLWDWNPVTHRWVQGLDLNAVEASR